MIKKIIQLFCRHHYGEVQYECKGWDSEYPGGTVNIYRATCRKCGYTIHGSRNELKRITRRANGKHRQKAPGKMGSEKCQKYR